MQFIIELIRKVVILVLLMEVVLQLQSGKQYEGYIKMLVGIMVIYSLVSGIFGVLGKMENGGLAPMQEFRWHGNLFADLQNQAQEEMEDNNIPKAEELMTISTVTIQVDVPTVGKVNIEQIHVGK